ncbi:Putative uncharacterized protein C1orf145, partial [Manacus vitellinus]
TASSSAVTFCTVSRRYVPSSSMLYFLLCLSLVSSLNQEVSVPGTGTSHWKVADSFSLTSRSFSFSLKGMAGSSEGEN